MDDYKQDIKALPNAFQKGLQRCNIFSKFFPVAFKLFLWSLCGSRFERFKYMASPILFDYKSMVCLRNCVLNSWPFHCSFYFLQVECFGEKY